MQASSELQRAASENGRDQIHVHAKTLVVLASVALALVAQLLSVVASGFLAQPVSHFFNRENEAVWMSEVIAIGIAVLCPPMGQIGDYWGRKWALVFVNLCGCVGTIVASRAQSMETVITGFSIMSFALGGQPLLYAVASEVLPRKQRFIAQAVLNAATAIGGIFGVVMGGALLRNDEMENFHIYFYVSAAVSGCATLGLLVCYNPPSRAVQTELTTAVKLRALDWIGYLLLTPGLVLFCIALAWSRNPYPWSDIRILATFITGLVLLVLFGLYEWRFEQKGLLHHALFLKRNFNLTLFVVFAEGFAFFTLNSYLVFEIEVFTQKDILISALPYAVLLVVMLVAAFVVAIYSTRTKTVRPPVIAGFVLITISFVCMAVATPYFPYGAFWGFAAICGVGFGAILPVLFVIAQMSTPPEMISNASALILSIRSVGGTVGLAVNNAIFNGTLATQVPKKISEVAISLGLPDSSVGLLIRALTAKNSALLAEIPGSTPEIVEAAEVALTEAYGTGFRYTWITGACVTTLATFAVICFTEFKSEFTAHIDAPVEVELIQLQARYEDVGFGLALPASGKKPFECTTSATE